MNNSQKRIFLSSFIFAIIIFIAHFMRVGTAVYGDGRYYYSYLPTILIQRTFDFSRSFHFYGLPFIYSPTHYLQNAHTIGPAIVWSLPYLIGFAAFYLFHFTSPYNIFLQIPIGILDVTLVFAGLFFVFRSLQKYFSRDMAFITTMTIFFATDLFFYGSIDVLNSHSITFFFASLFIYIWLSKNSIRNAVILGISLGMLVLTRTQDAIFIILPLITLLDKKIRYIPYFLIMGITTTVLFIPQSFLWRILWGNWFKNPYLYGATFDFLHPQILGVLFNTYDGLFLWTPITLVATAGLVILSKKYKSIGIGFCSIFALTLYLIASFEIWWGGASYSARYFISALPIFSFGIAFIYEKYLSFKKQLIVSIFFSILNFALIFYFLIHK